MLTNQQKLRNRIIALFLTEGGERGDPLQLNFNHMVWGRYTAHYYNEKELEKMLKAMTKRYF